MRILLVLLLLVAGAHGQSHSDTACKPAKTSQRAQWSSFTVEMVLKRKPVKVLQGTVRDQVNEPVAGIFIEVFAARADGSFSTEMEDPKSVASRVEACNTDASGAFSFDLPTGKYKLRASATGWQMTTLVVSVDLRQGKR